MSEVHKGIEKLNLNQKEICIHSSMKSFGEHIERGADTLIDIFLEHGCTIMVPTFSDMYEGKPTKKYMPSRNGAGDYSFFLEREYEKVKAFDTTSKKITVEDMGTFAKSVLDRKESVRGNHPLNSFTALGENANRLICSQTNREVYAPLKQLCEDDGFILLMGVSLTEATIIHYAEQLSGRNPFVRWAQASDGTVIPCLAGGCSEGFGHFEETLAQYVKKLVVGKSVWNCYRARTIVELCKKKIQENPTITHCGDLCCDRCNDAVQGGPNIDNICF